MSAPIKLQGLYNDMTSAEYHGHKGTFSSSQLKDLLEDEEIFYRKHITKEQERETSTAFDVGTYFHTTVLEPDKVQDECAVYEGVRRGKEWDAFKAANPNKAILIPSEHKQALGLVEAVRNSPVAMGRISQGSPEVSAFVDINVSCGEIFNLSGQILGKYGWEDTKEKVDKKNYLTLPLKVRADLLADDFILDLKSTSGNAKSEFTVRQTVSKYSYDLSAALYLDLFSCATGLVKSEFIWTFASKDYFNCKNYYATSENIMVGRAKYKKALLRLADCIHNNWVFEDYLSPLAPQMFELEHLKIKGESLL